MIQAKLIVVGGDSKVAEINLKLPCTIGRGKGATLTLPHPLISRQHCEVFEAEGKLMVRDLGSLNGTFIGSERISEAELPHGELLTIGTVTFRAAYDSEAQPFPPVAPSAETELNPGQETVREAPLPVEFQEAEEIEEIEEIDEIDELLGKPEPAEQPSSAGETSVSAQAASDDEDFGIDFSESADDEDASVSESDDSMSDFLKEFGED